MSITEINLTTQAQDATLKPSKISTNAADNFVFPNNVTATSNLLTPAIQTALATTVIDVNNSRLLSGGLFSMDWLNRILYANDGSTQNLTFATPGTVDINGTLDMMSHNIIHVATPVNASDVANKSYVDTTAQGLSIKASCAAATTTTLPAYTYNNGSSGVGATITENANGAFVVDGYTANVNDRILVKDETGANEPYNGIYSVTQTGSASAPFVLTRTTDFDSSSTITPGSFTFINGGTVNANSGWVLSTAGTITVGTTNLMFTQFSGAGEIIAGNGLTKTGNELDVHPSDTSLTVHVGDINVARDPAGAIGLTSNGLSVNVGNALSISGNNINVNPGNGLSISGNAIGITAPVSIANGGTNTTSQTTNGLNYFDGIEITSGSALTWNASTATLTAFESGFTTTLIVGDFSASGIVSLPGFGQVRFGDVFNSSNYVALQAPHITTTYILKLPVAQGATNSIIQNDGSGNLSFTASPTLSSLTLSTPLSVGSGGTGLSTAPTNGQVLIGNGANYSLATITGTTNEVIVTNGSGTITLSTPQAIATTSSPTFASLTLTNPLTVGNGGTGTSTPALVAGSNITITGSWPNNTINAVASGSSGNIQYSNGTNFVGASNVNTDGTNVTLGNAGSITLTTPLSGGSQSGGGITITTGINEGAGTTVGGGITLSTGAAESGSQVNGNMTGGSITLTTGLFVNGSGTPTVQGGSINLTTGQAQGSGGTTAVIGGSINLSTGPLLNGGTLTGGSITLSTGSYPNSSVSNATTGGSITLTSGNSNGGTDVGGNIKLTSYTPANGGSIVLTGTGANGTSSSPAHGNIYANYLNWTGGLTAAGSNQQIQFNNNGLMSANSALFWNNALSNLYITNGGALSAALLLDTGSNSAVQLNARQLISGAGHTQLDWSVDGTVELTNAALNMNSHQIHNVTDPTSAQDAATKNYVDSNAFETVVTTVTTTTTITTAAEVYLCNAASAGFTITLPTAASSTNKAYTIKKIDSTLNTVTLQGNGSDVIDGSNTQTLNGQWQSYTVVSNGTSWYII